MGIERSLPDIYYLTYQVANGLIEMLVLMQYNTPTEFGNGDLNYFTWR